MEKTISQVHLQLDVNVVGWQEISPESAKYHLGNTSHFRAEKAILQINRNQNVQYQYWDEDLTEET